ncbi:MAG: hypothetical protein LBV67_09020 [Streptococcaceae bacterium]|nr:hypothetical protein [Streptococcaceae bacterium]
MELDENYRYVLTEDLKEWIRNSINIDEWPKEMNEERLSLYQTIQQQVAEGLTKPITPMKETEYLPF